MRVETTKSAIKGAIVDRLKTPCNGAYPTLAGPRVHKSRFGPLQSEELPAIIVFLAEETSSMLDTESDRRVAKVQIEIQAEGDDADMQIDVIGDQVIANLRNDPYLGGVKNGLVDSLRYERGQLFYDERRHVDCTCWVLDYEARYTASTVPDHEVSDVADFKTAEVTYHWPEGTPPPAVQNVTADSHIDIPA